MRPSSATVVVTQSNYIPWRGWFDMVRQADCLVLLDTVQYTRRDWRNRNRIKTPNGLAWLTVPVDSSGRFDQSIDDTRISAPGWADAHLRSIELSYRRADHFEAVFPWLAASLREAAAEPMLSRMNELLIRGLCARLGIPTRILRDSDLIPKSDLTGMESSERLAALAEAAGGKRYLSGPAARAYLETPPFDRRGIEVAWMSYPAYPEYPQLWGGFEPAVSVVDLMLNTGDGAPRWLAAAASAGPSCPATPDNPPPTAPRADRSREAGARPDRR